MIPTFNPLQWLIDRIVEGFQKYLSSNPDAAQAIETAYNRTFRGFVTPEFSADDLEIARWNTAAPPLHGYQRAGGRRLIEQRGGLLSFDVGLGKTRNVPKSNARRTIRRTSASV